MNKLLNCIIVILLSFILIACSEKILYLKPEMFGQLYDSRTHKPLSTIHGYIGYDTARDGEFKHEVRQFQKPYDNQQAEQISLMV